MNTGLQPVADALADLADSELRTLKVAVNEILLMAAGFLTWVEHLTDWEMNRRAGLDAPMQPPGVSIPPEEHVESIVAATMLRDGFAEGSGQESHPVVAFFDAIVGALNLAGGSPEGRGNGA